LGGRFAAADGKGRGGKGKRMDKEGEEKKGGEGKERNGKGIEERREGEDRG